MLDDADAVALEAAQRILQSAARAIAARGLFRIVLAGGRTPEAAYRLLVGADTDWSRWEIYFGDERCLPVDDAERNSRMAARALLDAVAIPAANVHPIPAEHGAEAAAKAYQPVIRAALPFIRATVQRATRPARSHWLIKRAERLEIGQGNRYTPRPLMRGGAVWQLVGLITRRS